MPLRRDSLALLAVMRCVPLRPQAIHSRSVIKHEVHISFRKERITQKSLFCLSTKEAFYWSG